MAEPWPLRLLEDDDATSGLISPELAETQTVAIRLSQSTMMLRCAGSSPQQRPGGPAYAKAAMRPRRIAVPLRVAIASCSQNGMGLLFILTPIWSMAYRRCFKDIFEHCTRSLCLGGVEPRCSSNSCGRPVVDLLLPVPGRPTRCPAHFTILRAMSEASMQSSRECRVVVSEDRLWADPLPSRPAERRYARYVQPLRVRRPESGPW